MAYVAFNDAVATLYNGATMQLGQDDLNDVALSNALNNMARKVYDAGDFDIDLMAEAEAMEMTGATFEHFQKAIEKGLRDSEHAGYKASPVIRYALENNAFVFSGFKTYHMLREVGLSITDDAGNIKPFERFLKDVHTVDERYNRNY